MTLPGREELDLDALAPASTSTELVEDVDVGKSGGLLPMAQVAQMLGVSVEQVRRQVHERKLPAAPRRGARGQIMIRESTVREFIAQSGDPRRRAPSPVAKAHLDGERDARVFEALEAGKTISEIVISTRTAAETVIHLRKLWLESKRADLEGVVHMCMGCHAVPGNPAISYCSDCGSKARVLTDAQIATLKDKA